MTDKCVSIIAADGEYFFLEGDLKLSKVAPGGWKEPGKGAVAAPFTTYLRVKFYVDGLASIRYVPECHTAHTYKQ